MKTIYKLILSNPLIRKYLNKRFEIDPKNVKLGFINENGLWYADIKNWPKEFKAQCLMVGQAAKLLSFLSPNDNYITLSISTQKCPCLFSLIKYKEDDHGATYNCEKYGLPEIWLCNVTKFVFGEHPNELYINVVRED